jgi:hypothetical protein
MVPRDPVTLLLLAFALFVASMVWIRARIDLVTAVLIVAFIMLATFAAIQFWL